jgi:hypothetical protein
MIPKTFGENMSAIVIAPSRTERIPHKSSRHQSPNASLQLCPDLNGKSMFSIFNLRMEGAKHVRLGKYSILGRQMATARFRDSSCRSRQPLPNILTRCGSRFQKNRHWPSRTAALTHLAASSIQCCKQSSQSSTRRRSVRNRPRLQPQPKCSVLHKD